MLLLGKINTFIMYFSVYIFYFEIIIEQSESYNYVRVRVLPSIKSRPTEPSFGTPLDTDLHLRSL